MVLQFVLASVWYASVLVCLTRRRAADEGSKESEHGSFFFFAERGTLFASSLSTTLSTKSCRSPQKSLEILSTTPRSSVLHLAEGRDSPYRRKQKM